MRANTAASRFLANAIALMSRGLPVPGFYACIAEPVLRALASSAVFIVRRDGNVMGLRLDDYVQRRVFCWSLARAELAFTRRWCRPGDTMVDVGSNIGVFTLVASRAVGVNGSVVSIEANPRTVRELEANVARNAARNVCIVDAAVGETSGTVSVGMIDERQGSGAVSVAGTVDVVTVAKTTLDDVLHSYGRARLVKIDVEGFEPAALVGAGRTLDGEHAPEVVLIEINEVALARFGSSGADICSILGQHGYRIFRRSMLGTLKPFRPLIEADARRGIAFLDDTGRIPFGLLRRVYWSKRLLLDAIAVHPQTALESVRRAYRRQLPFAQGLGVTSRAVRAHFQSRFHQTRTP
jgi:FkbM family methyltransferase